MQPLAQPPATKDSGLTRWLFLAWKKLLDSFNSDNFSGTEWEDLTDGGQTSLHKHDHAAQDNLNSTDYTHLTAANHTDLTDGGLTTLHEHDNDHIQYPAGARVGSVPHVDTLQELINHEWSAGVIDSCDLTKNGDGTVSIAAGQGMLRSTADPHTTLYACEVPAQANIALTDNATNYIYLDWNAGVPQFSVSTDIASFNCLDKCIAYVVHRSGTTLHALDAREQNVDGNRKIRRLLLRTSKFNHAQGTSIIGASGLAITVTAGEFHFMLQSQPHDAFDTSVAGTANVNVFTLWYQDGIGGWTEVPDQKLVSTTTYDGATGTPVTLGNNKFGVTWFYIIHDSPSELHAVMGQAQYANEAEAEAASPPSTVPTIVDGIGSLIGVVIYEKSAVAFANVLSAFSTVFSASAASNHNNLAGLQGGALSEYYHLTAAQATDLTDGGDSALHYHATDRLLSNITGFGANVATALATPTTANFNAMLSDNDFATLAGTETLTNKTLTTPDINGGTVDSAAIGATTPSTGAFTTLSSTENATLGDSIIFDAHTLNGATTLNSAKFAAISASLPALSYVASCFHLEANDTVKWRKRKGQSWRSEARSPGKYLGVYANATAAVAAGGATGDVFYSTDAAAFHEITGATTSSVTYRAGKEDYPTNDFGTVEAGRPIIWDADGATPSMWAVGPAGLGTITSVQMLNQKVVIGSSTGVWEYDFMRCSWSNYNATNRTMYSRSAFTTLGSSIGTIATPIVNATVNSVAITVLPDAPVDEYGMPIPTIAVATAAGVSCIKDDGNVWDITYGGRSISHVAFTCQNRIVADSTAFQQTFTIDIPSADNTASPPTGANVLSNATIPALLPTSNSGIATGVSSRAFASTSGVTFVVENIASIAGSMVSYITTTYNTGYIVGDIRGAWLANSATADRSVKANTLTAVGSVTADTSMAVNAYSGWSASVYSHRASDADWDTLGTGSVCMMGWFNCTGNSAAESLMGFANAGNTVRCLVTLTAAGLLECIDDGATAAVTTATTSALDNSAWHHFAFVRTSSTSRALYVDGKLITSNTTDAGSITDTGNLPFAIGINPDLTNTPATTTSLALLRMGATAPTAKQIKHIYATEAPLFVAGNTCLLSNSNTVSTLTYNPATMCYEVGNGTNVDTFSGLQRIASQAHGVTTLKSIASSGPYKLIAGTGATFTTDERNIKSELAETSKVKRTQNYSFTSSGTTWALPQGWKAQGVLFNLTDGTMAAVTQTFDGFLWTMTGLTTAKAHQVQLVEV